MTAFTGWHHWALSSASEGRMLRRNSQVRICALALAITRHAL